MAHNGTQYLCAGVVYGVERAAALLGSVGEQEEVSEDGLAAGAIRKRSPGQQVLGTVMGSGDLAMWPAAMGLLPLVSSSIKHENESYPTLFGLL